MEFDIYPYFPSPFNEGAAGLWRHSTLGKKFENTFARSDFWRVLHRKITRWRTKFNASEFPLQDLILWCWYLSWSAYTVLTVGKPMHITVMCLKIRRWSVRFKVNKFKRQNEDSVLNCRCFKEQKERFAYRQLRSCCHVATLGYIFVACTVVRSAALANSQLKTSAIEQVNAICRHTKAQFFSNNDEKFQQINELQTHGKQIVNRPHRPIIRLYFFRSPAIYKRDISNTKCTVEKFIASNAAY